MLDAVLLLVGAGGISTIVAALIAGFFNKRKLSAESTEIIQRAAGAQVERLEAENIGLRKDREDDRARIAVLEDKVDAASEAARRANRRIRSLERERNELRRILEIHGAWDFMAIAKLRELGVNFEALPDAPPLTTGLPAPEQVVQSAEADEEEYGE